MILLINIFIISFFVLGIATITQEGMIFYFLRKPLDNIKDKIEATYEDFMRGSDKHRADRLKECNTEEDMIVIEEVYQKNIAYHEEWKSKQLSKKLYWFKPLILCPPCMCSVWGSLAFWTLNYGQWVLWPEWIISVIAASFIVLMFWIIKNKWD